MTDPNNIAPQNIDKRMNIVYNLVQFMYTKYKVWIRYVTESGADRVFKDDGKRIENSMKDQADILIRKAYAKINLGLDVVGRLENGYHEVRMIMQTVGIYDLLTFRPAKSGIRITADSGELPTDGNNLIYKAARLLMENCGIEAGVDIYLEKHIPIAAGMAGN